MEADPQIMDLIQQIPDAVLTAAMMPVEDRIWKFQTALKKIEAIKQQTPSCYEISDLKPNPNPFVLEIYKIYPDLTIFEELPHLTSLGDADPEIAQQLLTSVV